MTKMVYMHESDETLVMLTLAGEQRAYEVLVTRHQKSVIAAAKSITRNSFMAEDSAQDAFVTAWMKLDTLQNPEKFVYWVCRIAKNCALNTVDRFRAFIPLCDVENTAVATDADSNPEEAFVVSESETGINKQVERLPEKVRKIIYLHYYDGLSIAEIADRMRIPEGTVKWQLYDGRKRIRKELCAMNEKENDNLTEKVMKKVEELKLWQLRNSKDGFEKVYADVLSEVEKLPESGKRSHALADVLMRGWWWLPGDKNDALFARIKEAAVAGGNEEVMRFIAMREDNLVQSGGAREDFIKNKQIPYLEKAGFKETLAYEWLHLGKSYVCSGSFGDAKAAFEKAKETVPEENIYHSLADESIALADVIAGFEGKNKRRYRIETCAFDIRRIGGGLCFWGTEYGVSEGWITSTLYGADDIFRNASYCDGKFLPSALSPGETVTGTDGTTVTYESDGETVETPCGTFENCRLVTTKYYDEYEGLRTFRTYYKDGVGIVKQIISGFPASEERILCGFRIAGGEGILPLAVGNSWEYRSDYDDDTVRLHLRFAVTSATETSAVIVSRKESERLKYDDKSWMDMMRLIRSDYWTRENGIGDVSYAIDRAEALADTPFRKAFTNAAISVARRIRDTDANATPDAKATGHWNFFVYGNVRKKDGRADIKRNGGWSFELKSTNDSVGCNMTLYNDVYGLLSSSANALWSDEWRIGAEPTVEFDYVDHIKSNIRCEKSEPITTKAGTFENCIRLTINTTGLENSIGRRYRGFGKTYYFAEGVGIVRADFECLCGVKTVTYELTEYEGTGEGYMPLEDGMMRRYDGMDIPDGYVSYAVYTYAKGDDGELVIFEDRCGIRITPPRMTDYCDIYDELREEELWENKEHWRSRALRDVNNLRIMVHYLERNQRYIAKPDRAVAWHKHVIKLLESFGDDGEVPPAWKKKYYRSHFICGTALFGAGKRDEGFEYIEKAFELCKQAAEVPENEPLDVGAEHLFGGIKLIPATGVIVLPDGGKDICSEWPYYFSSGYMYYAMTAKRGWEWFNSVRGDERFIALIERARKLAEEEKN